MRLLETIGRMLLGSAIRRALWRSPRTALVAAAIVGLLLMLVASMPARAQAADCGPSPIACDKGQAHAKAVQFSTQQAYCGGGPLGTGRVIATPGQTAYSWQAQHRCPGESAWGPVAHTYYYACPANAPWDPATNTCKSQCTSKPDITVTRPPYSPAGQTAPNQFAQCVGGCAVKFQNMHDGTFVGVHASNATCNTPGLPDTSTCTAMGMVSGIFGCQPPANECGPGRYKDATTGECSGQICPAGQIVGSDGGCKPEAPTCPPGQIKAPSGACLPGEGMCSSGQARGKDGTCKKDSNGDGVPDSEQGEGNEDGEDADGNSFSGGDNCNNPPACSGNPIMCGQARIQWRIECNTRTKVNITGGTCGAQPVCVGENCNLMEYAQLMQQWRTACTLEKMAQGTPTSGRDGLLEWAEQTRAADTEAANAIAGQGDGLEGISVSDAWRKPQQNDGQAISETLFGSGSPAQCSISGGFDLRGHSIDPGPRFWWLMGWLGWLFPALAYLWLAQKLGG